MCKTNVIAGILIVIVLAGLPAGVQAQGDDDGVVAILGLVLAYARRRI